MTASTKCNQMGCKCPNYIENASKWSKGKCKSCNHSQKMHGITNTTNRPRAATISTDTNIINTDNKPKKAIKRRSHSKSVSEISYTASRNTKPEMVYNYTSSGAKQRNQWSLGSKVEIYSDGQSKWYKGEIIKIYTDDEGEWLVVKYGGFRKKDIGRFNDYIRPIQSQTNKQKCKLRKKKKSAMTVMWENKLKEEEKKKKVTIPKKLVIPSRINVSSTPDAVTQSAISSKNKYYAGFISDDEFPRDRDGLNELWTRQLKQYLIDRGFGIQQHNYEDKADLIDVILMVQQKQQQNDSSIVSTMTRKLVIDPRIGSDSNIPPSLQRLRDERKQNEDKQDEDKQDEDTLPQPQFTKPIIRKPRKPKTPINNIYIPNEYIPNGQEGLKRGEDRQNMVGLDINSYIRVCWRGLAYPAIVIEKKETRKKSCVRVEYIGHPFMFTNKEWIVLNSPRLLSYK